MPTEPTVRSRRLDYSESTRAALVAGAVELFTQRGYAGASLDEVARLARVTKGALYHHFTGKQALFEAVFDTVENDVLDRLRRVIAGPEPAWERSLNALRTFLACCLEPAYQRVVMQEAPVVMGFERWRAAEENYTFGILRDILAELVEAGEIEPVPVETTARVLFGALSSSAMAIAGSADPATTSTEVEHVITQLLGRMRRDRG